MNTPTHLHFNARSGGNILPVSAFSAYGILRNYNYLLGPQSSEFRSKLQSPRVSTSCSLPSPTSEEYSVISCLNQDNSFLNFTAKPFSSAPSLFSYRTPSIFQSEDIKNHAVAHPCSSLLTQCYKRQRGEKKPIPAEQKDDKYFERRRRNNQAAKKSRDARKLREDQIALKATLLEHENAILKAQLLTLREEAASLRQMLLQKKTLESASRDIQLCRL